MQNVKNPPGYDTAIRSVNDKKWHGIVVLSAHCPASVKVHSPRMRNLTDQIYRQESQDAFSLLHPD